MVRKTGKVILIILIFILVFNLGCPIVLAEDTTASGSPFDSIVDFGSAICGYAIKLFGWILAKSVYLITQAAGGPGEMVSPESILFNKLSITNINFFDGASSVKFVTSLRENIATWYYVMRTIAIIASVCVLLYIAIRMAISTVASEKAEYKRMLTDWIVGFALIFMLHYIILLVINGNNLIVDTLYESVKTTATADPNAKISSYLTTLEDKLLEPDSFTESFGALMIYMMLVGITLAFLLMYIKRMIVIAFLIIISPLITITYAIDKVGDSKSQALDAWFKEFLWTVLIQPFHCVIYVVFVTISIDSIQDNSFSSSILAIMCMVFIMQAEEIIKKIFGVQADNVGKMSSSMALVAGGFMAARKYVPTKKSSGGSGSNENTSGAKKSNANVKTKDGIGSGIGKPNDAETNNTYAQKMANLYDSPKVQNSLKKFNNFLEDTKTGKTLKYLGKGTAVSTDFGFKAASMMFGAAMSAPVAKSIDELAGGVMTGYAMGQGYKNVASRLINKGTRDVVEKGRTRNAQSNLTESYKQMKNETHLNTEQMEKRAKVLVETDLESEIAKGMNDVEKLFVNNYHTMKSRMEKAGEDTSFKNVYKKINLKDVEK